MRIFSKGFNYSQDGQGNRLVYHLQGCNMKCGWCSNPEGMTVDGELVTDDKWLVDSICPYGAIFQNSLDRRLCRDCGDRACITRHRSKGINLSYIEYDTQSILAEIENSAPMFSGDGGVTFTGGEPTLQFSALEELLKGSAQAGVHTAVETNGTHRKLEKLFPLIDQLIMDFKIAGEEKHLKFTGVPNKQIKANFRKAFASGKPLLVRVPVINNINANEEEILEIIDFMAGNDTSGTCFELLPYHEYGKVKWEKCGKAYPISDGYVDADRIAYFEELFKQNGLVTKRT